MKIFDAHFHIIDPQFPLVPNQGFLPDPFQVDDYRTTTNGFKTSAGAIVSGSFQGFDQEYLISALRRMGNTFCGVANIPADISDEEVFRLHQAGIRAVRFNLKRGGSARLGEMVALSNRLWEMCEWRTELYVDSRDLADLQKELSQLPCFSIDHLGLSEAGLTELYKWVEKGAKVKATGFGRVDFDPLEVMKQIHSLNPNAMMFGTDLPSTRAKRPFSQADIQLLRDNFPDADQHLIFWQNAAEWYRLPPTESP